MQACNILYIMDISGMVWQAGVNIFVPSTCRKEELYSMAWQDTVDISKAVVSAGAFGGPIGMKTEEKIM